jgi:hypothetical protein
MQINSFKHHLQLVAGIAFTTWNMADGLYWVVCGVDNGEKGGQDPEQDGGGHQGDGGDVQLVQQERSLPKHCSSEDFLPQLNKLDPN